MQFCFISRKRICNGALQDQSSSHLSAVLEIPDFYSTTRRSCFVPRFFICVHDIFPYVRVLPFPSPLFADFYSRLSHFRRSDDARASCASRWLFRVIEGGFPGWCKLNRKRLLGLFYLPARFSNLVRYPRIILLSGLLLWSLSVFLCASQSIGKFIRSRDSRQTKVTAWM